MIVLSTEDRLKMWFPFKLFFYSSNIVEAQNFQGFFSTEIIFRQKIVGNKNSNQKWCQGGLDLSQVMCQNLFDVLASEYFVNSVFMCSRVSFANIWILKKEDFSRCLPVGWSRSASFGARGPCRWGSTSPGSSCWRRWGGPVASPPSSCPAKLTSLQIWNNSNS